MCQAKSLHLVPFMDQWLPGQQYLSKSCESFTDSSSQLSSDNVTKPTKMEIYPKITGLFNTSVCHMLKLRVLPTANRNKCNLL